MKITLDEMRAVYQEFGIDIHAVPPEIQSAVNSTVREVIRLRKIKGGKL